MIYKSPAPSLKHEIFASTPFSKYMKLVHALVKGPTKKKKKSLPTDPLFFGHVTPNTDIFLLGLTYEQFWYKPMPHDFEKLIVDQWSLNVRKWLNLC